MAPLCATDKELEAQIDVSDWFQMKVLEIKSKLLTFKDTLNCSTPKSASNMVKLPKIDLPQFDGRYENWQSFQDLFLASVDKNNSLSSAQKLQYLKSCAKGEAANLIKSFTVTDQNYREAWSLLTDRYDNKRELVSAQLKRLFNQPEVRSQSATHLQSLIDVTNECTRSLKVLGRPMDTCEDFIVHIVTEKLDPESRREWAKSLKGSDPPTFDELQLFIDNHIRGLHASGSQPTTNYRGEGKSRHQAQGPGRQTSSHHSSTEENCPNCKGTHPLFRCQSFRDLSIEDRMNTARQAQLCFNCLRHDHRSVDCKSFSTCKTCGKHHHTLLHSDRRQKPTTPATNQPGSETTSVNFAEEVETTQVLLKTALAHVKNQDGEVHVCRILKDDGSKTALITEACVRRLGLEKRKCHVIIRGISSAKACTAKAKVTLNITSMHSSEGLQVEALVVPKCTEDLPSYPCNPPTAWSHIDGLKLADPNYHAPAAIDILLGGDVTASLMRDGIKHGPRMTPVAQNTIFGWVLSGRISSLIPGNISVNHADSDGCSTDSILQRFWELEELPPVKLLLNEEKMCQQHFSDNLTRQDNGRYVVKLPFKSNAPSLGSSRGQAVTRLKSLERRFKKYPNYKDEYIKFMREYLALNHMQIVPESDIQKSNGVFYLPHHFVLKEDSTTTKFRVVFDGSAKSSSGVSLNNVLMVGPTIQDDLFTLLLRFRTHTVALKADITKMYRQFEVHPNDMDYQRIVWRESENDPILDYKLSTVTYGTGSASYLATRCLQQLAMDEKDKHPEAAQVVLNDMYIDDLMSGDSNAAAAISLQQQLSKLGQDGGLDFRKWATNDHEVLQSIPLDARETELSLDFDNGSTIKALGVKWCPAQDTFLFNVNPTTSSGPVTKRNLLSDLAKVFDPLGWLSPTTIIAKMMFQSLWKDNTGWDEPLNLHMQQQWHDYQKQLHHIKSIRIPRCIIPSATISKELHGFGDASKKAYAAAVYLRCRSSDGTIVCNLIASRTRVAPIKVVSISRLELCGSLLLAELAHSIKQAMKLTCPVYAYSDSTNALDWLASFPGRWKTFVANRVSRIQELIPFQQWSHVPGEENPADAPSRGISAEDLSHSSMWWHGPKWLSDPNYTANPYKPNLNTNLEEEKAECVAHHATIESYLPCRYSSLSKLKRVTALLFRFCDNCKLSLNEKLKGPLTPMELDAALTRLIKQAQNLNFEDDIKLLQNKKCVQPNSQLKQLCPFLDQHGVLRVGGRLQNANLTENRKHQIILPHDDPLTTLIIRNKHLSLLHSGFQLTMSSIMQDYWILKGRATIRFIIRKCVTCRRQRAELSQQLMGSLPSPRVVPGRPFLRSGVDYAGPFNIKPFKGRSNRTLKCYFAIFVCLSTKAVHLEAVTDMTSESFIAALRRFTAIQ